MPSGGRTLMVGWPWTCDRILNHGYFLDDLRDQHFVTAELLREAADLSTKQKIELAIVVRYRQSPQGFATRCAQAIKDGNLPAAINRPVAFATYAPYRCVVRKDHLGSVVEKVAASAAGRTPFPNLGEANTFFKSRIMGVATDKAYFARQSPFCAAEVARDLFAMGLVTDGSNADMETGARVGLSLARRFWPSAQWSQIKLASAMGADNSCAEIIWCEFEKYCSCFNEGIRSRYIPQNLRGNEIVHACWLLVSSARQDQVCGCAGQRA